MKETSAYNATVVGKILITPDIMVLRVNADEPGQNSRRGNILYLVYMGTKAVRRIRKKNTHSVLKTN